MTDQEWGASAGRCEAWLPVVGSGTEDDPWRPDVPPGMPFEVHGGLVTPVGDELREAPVHTASGRRFPTVTRYVCVTVEAARVPEAAAAVPLEAVPAEDRLLVELNRSIERDAAGRLKRRACDRITEILLREAGSALEADTQGAVVRLLRRMERRGFPPTAARSVRREISRATTTPGGGI
jgi:hypothetical protein